MRYNHHDFFSNFVTAEVYTRLEQDAPGHKVWQVLLGVLISDSIPYVTWQHLRQVSLASSVQERHRTLATLFGELGMG